MCQKKLIAITGGIGSGKSVVSSVLRNMGHSVYDCDYEAKRLMNTSPIIKQELITQFGDNVYYIDGTINKALLSSIIFNNRDALSRVNSIVHPVVKDDLQQWHNSHPHQFNFVETAILKEAGMISMVNVVWHVTAPIELRINRVMKRNNISREKVLERIYSQSTKLEDLSNPVLEIVNDEVTPILPQIISLLNAL